MSTINGLNGPRLPSATPSAAGGAPSTSFLSRVQASTSGVSTLSRQANAPLVSGRDVIAKAVSAAKSGAAQAAVEADPQKQAIMEMSRAFVMGTVQSIFAGVGQSGSSLPKQEDWG